MKRGFLHQSAMAVFFLFSLALVSHASPFDFLKKLNPAKLLGGDEKVNHVVLHNNWHKPVDLYVTDAFYARIGADENVVLDIRELQSRTLAPGYVALGLRDPFLLLWREQIRISEDETEIQENRVWLDIYVKPDGTVRKKYRK